MKKHREIAEKYCLKSVTISMEPSGKYYGCRRHCANASAPAAALFSTVVMKIGLLGILTLSLLGGNAPLWWGIALLVLGMITAFVGGLYALMEHNIQRLLAYHPGKYRHYPAGAGRWRNGYRARTTGADCSWPGRWSVPSA